MTRHTYAVMFLAAAIGVAATGCGGSDSKTAETSSTAAASATDAGQLPSLIPTPANTQSTKGPDSLSDNGIHLYFQVTGSPAEVMKAYKAALEAKKWDVTNVVTSDGGATYTGTNGAAYGVIDGGGWQDKTYIDVCAWPTKPADPNCKRSDR